MNYKILDDIRSEQRFEALRSRVGDKPQHYINQIMKCQGDKKLERAATFYKLANENGLTKTAKEIKSQFPDIYASQEEIQADRDAEAEAKRLKEEQEAKERAEAEAKKPINVLIANAKKTGRSACYGMSDEQVHHLENELYEELVPGSGPAPTEAGELLRAWNDLMYRWYNDGDWVAKDGGFNGNETFSPRSVSNMKYLTTHGAGQISIFFNQSDEPSEFERKVERMLLNQIVKKDLYNKTNSTDSRSYWKPSGRRR